MTALVHRVEALYADFMSATSQKIADVYAGNVIFRDPVHEIHGLEAMQKYFDGVSTNLLECRFEFDRTLVDGGQASLWWTMHYRHPRLSGGRALALRGASLLKLDLTADRVLVHEDVYDLGAMVYEQIPLLGAVIRRVKAGLAKS